MTETGSKEDSDIGTPQGGILSPLLANIALSVLDEQVMAPWKPDAVGHFTNWRVIRWLRKRHRWRWGQFRRQFTTASGRWLPLSADGVALFNPTSVQVIRYRYRGNKIPNPYKRLTHT